MFLAVRVSARAVVLPGDQSRERARKVLSRNQCPSVVTLRSAPDSRRLPLPMLPPLSGLVAAPFTPFRPNGDLALETIPQIAALLARNGVKGAFVCGTTGEGSSLTSEERREVAAAWRAAAPPGLALTVHVS